MDNCPGEGSGPPHFRKKVGKRYKRSEGYTEKCYAEGVPHISHRFLDSKKPAVYAGLMGVAEGRLELTDLRVMSPTSYQLLYSAMFS